MAHHQQNAVNDELFVVLHRFPPSAGDHRVGIVVADDQVLYAG
jgi:hypothetical protein